MKELKIEGDSVQNAIERGLKEMNLRRDQVEVVVLSEPTKGLFGFGSKPAEVVIREKKWGDEGAERSGGGRRGGRGRGGRGSREACGGGGGS